MKTRKSYLSESVCDLGVRIRKKKRIGILGEMTNGKALDSDLVPIKLNKNYPELFQRPSIFDFFNLMKKCSDFNNLHYFVKTLKNLLCSSALQYLQFIDTDILKILVKHLDMTKMVENVLWCLINITAFECKALVGLGIIQELVNLNEKCKKFKICDLVYWCLANIAGDCVKFRDLVIGANGIQVFFSGINEKLTRKNALWGISNLCKGKPAPEYRTIKKILKKIENFVNEDLDNTLSICEIIFACTGHEEFEYTGQPWVLPILSLTENSNLGFICLKILSNLTMKNNNLEVFLIQNNIFSKIIHFLQGENAIEQKEALLLINNLCMSGKYCIDALVKHKIFKLSLKFLSSENIELKNEAVCIVGAIKSNVQGQNIFVNSPFFLSFLNVFKSLHPGVVTSAISTMHQLMSNSRVREEFSRLDGKIIIEGLKDHPNNIVPLMASEFLEFHFN